MDTTNKYYSIIENMVKQHKKFAGCEPILNEIIDDVFLHSETIIHAIDNETVITAYLAKVVSTSVITVPKKLNFHAEIKHKEIMLDVPKTTVNDTQKTLIDKMINFPEPVSDNVQELEFEEIQTPEQTQNIILSEGNEELDSINIEEKEAIETFDKVLPDESTNEVLELEDIPEDLELNDIALQEEETLETIGETQVEESENEALELKDISEDSELNDIALQEEETLETVGETQVEESANETLELEDISEDSELNDIALQEEETLETVRETQVEESENEALELEDISEDSELNDIALQEEETLETVGETQVEESENEALELEDISEDLELNDIALQEEEHNNLDLLLEEENSDILEMNTVENNTELNSDNLPEESFILDDSGDFSNELLFAENDDNSLLFNNETDTVISEPEQETNNHNYEMPLDYSAFDYVPQTSINNTDIKIITTKLLELNEHKPDLQIAKVYELKYKQNMPIAEIASSLNISEDTVLQALNEIISIV